MLKRLKLDALIALTLALSFAAVALAQETPPPEAGTNLLEIIKGVLALPAVTMAILAALKHGVSALPNKYLPYIAPFLALAIDLGTRLLADINLTPAPGGAESAASAFFLGGTAGVGWHQAARAPSKAKEMDALEIEVATLKAELRKATRPK